MKTLHLILKKEWFDMILSGEKLEEYREMKYFWINRLTKKNLDPKHFDTITFSHGYANNRRQFVIELKEIEIDKGRPEWGAKSGEYYFVLKLGDIISKNMYI